MDPVTLCAVSLRCGVKEPRRRCDDHEGGQHSYLLRCGLRAHMPCQVCLRPRPSYSSRGPARYAWCVYALLHVPVEERSRFRRSVMWVLLLSGAACSCARDGASRTLLLVSVEVSEARSSMSTIEVDTVHSDERTISLAVIFVFIIYVRFIGIFCCPQTPT